MAIKLKIRLKKMGEIVKLNLFAIPCCVSACEPRASPVVCSTPPVRRKPLKAETMLLSPKQRHLCFRKHMLHVERGDPSLLLISLMFCSLRRKPEIWDLWNKGEATEIIDKLMNQETNDESEVMKCVHIGLLCVQENSSDRQDMPSVVSVFGHNGNDFPSPKHPAFTAGRKRDVKNGSGAWLSGENSASVNDVTLTSVHGR